MSTLSEKDACELLDADHLAVKHLFVDYARLASAADPSATETQRTALAATICEELTLHAQIEEQVFYPALREALGDVDAVLEAAMADHLEAKQLIADIRTGGAANPAMDTLVAELNMVIEQHMKEERDVLFTKARTAPALDLLALGQQMRTLQETAAVPAATGRAA